MIDKFATKEDLLIHLKENKAEKKALLIAEKKATIKQADAVMSKPLVFDKDKAFKSQSASELQLQDAIRVVPVINTTNFLDSHGDVHLNGIWNKSLKEKKDHYLIKEHQFNFDNVISDEVKAYTEEFAWSELGYNYEGKTEALIFESVIYKKSSPLMFDKYAKNKVKNHSVGMIYVKIDLAINSTNEDYIEEKSIWDKYINTIANKDEAINRGFFWVVYEAKVIEGSAVLMGSNSATPTLSATTIDEPSNDTHKSEPIKSLTIFEQLGKQFKQN